MGVAHLHLSNKHSNDSIKHTPRWALIVAQMVETPEIRGSNPIISNFGISSTVLKKQRNANCPIVSQKTTCHSICLLLSSVYVSSLKIVFETKDQYYKTYFAITQLTATF